MGPSALTQQREEGTWGVWDNEQQEWMRDYGQGTDLHRRQRIARRHAEHAAANENRLIASWGRYEARDMDANIKTVIDDGPALHTIGEPYARVLIRKLEAEINERLIAIATIKRLTGVN